MVCVCVCVKWTEISLGLHWVHADKIECSFLELTFIPAGGKGLGTSKDDLLTSAIRFSNFFSSPFIASLSCEFPVRFSNFFSSAFIVSLSCEFWVRFSNFLSSVFTALLSCGFWASLHWQLQLFTGGLLHNPVGVDWLLLLLASEVFTTFLENIVTISATELSGKRILGSGIQVTPWASWKNNLSRHLSFSLLLVFRLLFSDVRKHWPR